MNRYILFTHYGYYPSGGTDDISGIFKDLDAAKKAGEQSSKDYVQILNTKTGEIHEYNNYSKVWNESKLPEYLYGQD